LYTVVVRFANIPEKFGFRVLKKLATSTLKKGTHPKHRSIDRIEQCSHHHGPSTWSRAIPATRRAIGIPGNVQRLLGLLVVVSVPLET